MTIPGLRTETLDRLEFDIPDLEYQEKGLSVLDPLDDKIQLNTKINDNFMAVTGEKTLDNLVFSPVP